MSFNYSPRVITNGLVLYLDAANRKSYPGSGTAWNDLTINGNNGTLTNGPTFNSSNLGNIVFDGTNDFIATNLVTNYIDNHSQCIWYKWDGNNQLVTLTFLGNQSLNGLGLILHDGSSGNVGNRIGILYAGTSFNALPSSLPLVSNSWNNLVITRTTTTTTLYNNGQFFNSTLSSPRTSSTYSFNYGSVTSWGAAGNVSNISFYNRALSAVEVQQNYDALKGRFGL